MDFARFGNHLRGAGIAALGRGAAWLALAGILAVGVAHGQVFSPEQAAINHFSFVSLSLSRIEDNKSTVVSGGGGEIREEETNRVRFLASIKTEFGLGLGGLAAKRDYTLVTDTYTLADTREIRSAYISAHGHDLLFDEDEFYLVISTTSREDDFKFETFRRNVLWDTDVQVGLIYGMFGFLRLGVAEGRERLEVLLDDDPLGLSALEIFEFESLTLFAGVHFGDPEAVQFTAAWLRKESPSITGTVLSLDTWFEKNLEVTLTIYNFGISYEKGETQQSILPQSFYHSEETTVSLQFQVFENFTVGLSQIRVMENREFTLSGVQTERDTEHMVNRFSLFYNF